MNKKTWGVICLIGPFILLMVALVGYAIFSFVLVASGFDSTMVGNTIKTILGVVGLFSMVALVPGFIVGLILLLKK
ncbi:MAG: hypothetical protein UX09_C0030G0012 [Candidatus Uhrbacteria bacterium GW2011_GWE2_45_35]|uniref:Uncharacterized protein n=2 Tax=Candidatus Uhriibacteriota TaxID=1752732 RepID=A0A0G1JFY6_9BACT|nr:MAG: hypothetical protein UW63_C0024G0005 [Candidatus Uhrbacteria bacterium GW2011_GWF2_44_350]KKU07418.1 MAG: hypothetical protein UX09_C0030G0012 [Candidatus Uhrbacteria bacterium GW2011_GWE2_45_35]HBR80268.1 hypothetical protein [Candidatus Uhrbacteria bacterium]HCU31744.1 hypothetical protein [Candidatus Uhrbacteria bacterium]